MAQKTIKTFADLLPPLPAIAKAWGDKCVDKVISGSISDLQQLQRVTAFTAQRLQQTAGIPAKKFHEQIQNDPGFRTAKFLLP